MYLGLIAPQIIETTLGIVECKTEHIEPSQYT